MKYGFFFVFPLNAMLLFVYVFRLSVFSGLLSVNQVSLQTVSFEAGTKINMNNRMKGRNNKIHRKQ